MKRRGDRPSGPELLKEPAAANESNMSLTVFVGEKAPEVMIVRWFREPAYPNSYIEHPSGPVIKFSLEEFRSEGAKVVRDHFKAYETIRMAERDAIPVSCGVMKDATQVRAYLKSRVRRSETQPIAGL